MRTVISAGLVLVLTGCTMQHAKPIAHTLTWAALPLETSGHERIEVTTGRANLTLAIADTGAERELGLGLRDTLPNDGMLFVFDKPDWYSIWMKDMRFAIDILWLRNGNVVHVVANAQPEPGVADSELQQYHPSDAVDAVIELAAGRAAKLDAHEGSQLELRSLR